MPTIRSEMVASVVNDKIILIGPGSLDVYDVAANSWTIKEPMPQPVHGFGSATIDNKVYIKSWNLTQIYDPESDQWSLGASSPTSVSYPGVCATTGIMALKRVYVFGGTPSFLQVTNATQVYDPESDTWTLGTPMLTPRAGLSAAVVNDVVYAIGGGHGWGFIDNANEQYIPFGYGTPDPSYVPPDTTPPEIAVTSPENKTYYAADVALNFTVNEPVSSMRYVLDGESFEVSENITLSGLAYGRHNVTVYAVDVASNNGASETIIFTVAEEPFPVVPIATASVTVVAVVGVGLLVYFKKRKR
jgi:hypothetical protein